MPSPQTHVSHWPLNAGGRLRLTVGALLLGAAGVATLAPRAAHAQPVMPDVALQTADEQEPAQFAQTLP